MKLVGVLFGIEIIAMFAMAGIQSIRFINLSSTSNKKEGGGVIAIIVIIFLVCLALFVIGSVGIFFGNMIRSAISRQREYLADASSVQFTRNPSGLANALKKIGCPTVGSRIRAPKSAEMSHLFFGSVFSGSSSYVGFALGAAVAAENAPVGVGTLRAAAGCGRAGLGANPIAGGSSFSLSHRLGVRSSGNCPLKFGSSA